MLCRSVRHPSLRGVVGATLAGLLLGLGACDAETADTSPPRDTPVSSASATPPDTTSAPDEAVTDPGHDTAGATRTGARNPLNKVRESFARLAAEHVYEHPDVFAGVGWTGENSWHFTIQVAEDHQDAPEVAWIRDRVPDDQEHMVQFPAVAHSSSDLQHVKDLLGPRMEEREIIGLGSDFLHNAVRVIATPEDVADGGGHDAFLRDLQADVPADLRDAVVLREGEMPIADTVHGR